MLAARVAGLLTSTSVPMLILEAAWQLVLRQVALRLTILINTQPYPMESDRWDGDAWEEAAQKAKKKAMLADSGPCINAIKLRHPQALFPSRSKQAPWLQHFRTGC